MNFRTLDLNLLRVFDEVMAERNLTRAAATLAMTQPAVSNALRRLRDALGDELVVRAGHGVEPTPYALSIWPAVREALGGLRQVLVPTSFDPAGAGNSFVLAMADATAAQIVPPLIDLLQAQAPNVTLRVLPLTTRDPRALLEGSDLDLAIGYFPAAMAQITERSMQDATLPSVGYERLYDGRYVCVMRRDHPLAIGELTLDAYLQARHLLVSFSGRPFGFVDQALAAIKRQRRVVLTVNQFFTAGQVVARSDLLTVLPEHFVPSTGIAAALAIRPLPFEVPVVHVDMLWHRRQESRPAHGWLRERVVEAAQRGFERRPFAPLAPLSLRPGLPG
jgi:DNA-binding transcriptional LysR family regulator